MNTRFSLKTVSTLTLAFAATACGAAPGDFNDVPPEGLPGEGPDDVPSEPELARETTTISGHVRDLPPYGELGAVEVCAAGYAAARCTMTNEEGRFEIPDLPMGTELDMIFQRDGFLTTTRRVTTERPSLHYGAELMVATEDVPEGAMTGDTGAILVQVVELQPYQARPVEGLSIQLTDEAVMYRTDEIFDRASGSTDAEGLAFVAGVEPGEHALSATAMTGRTCTFMNPAAVSGEVTVHVTAGSVTTLAIGCEML